MAQRYTSLYSIKSNLYALDSPVVIEAGALLKDNKTGGVLGQLKFLNITNKKIISLTISLDTYDISDNYLEETEYTYMDLDASRDDSFGAKTPIVLENSSIRKFNPFVKKVIFDDKSCIELNKCEWQQIPKQEFLSNEFNEKYISAYKCTYSDSAEYFPVLFQKIWLCSCGKINSVSENECHYCNASQKDSLIEKDILQNKLTYIIAEELTKRETREAFVEALKYLKDIPEFGDAEKLIEKCNKKIEAIDKANYENQIAEEKASKKRKKIVFITTSIVCACIAFIIILNAFIIPNVKYQSAMKLFNAGKYAEAATAFNNINCKDSVARVAECNFLIQKDGLKNIAVGNTIKFGQYEQDNNLSNGREEIEWEVLAKEENKVLIISKFALECKQFAPSDEYGIITWEECTLRSWLNNEFYNEAFGVKQQSLIVSTTVSPPKLYEKYGSTTADKVFLLSNDEAKEYFFTDIARQRKPTRYAAANGAWVDSNNGNCFWWLRAPHELYQTGGDTVAHVGSDGSINYHGDYVNRDGGLDGRAGFTGNDLGCVCPAMWINIESLK